MKHYLFDTCFFVSLLIISDTNHDIAKQLFKEMLSQENNFYMSDAIFAELLTILMQKYGYQYASLMGELVQTYDITIFETSLEQANNMFLGAKTSLSVCDISVILDSKQYGYTVVSFDKKLLQAI